MKQENLTPHNQAAASVAYMRALHKAGWSNQLQSTIEDVFVLLQSLGFASAVAGDQALTVATEQPEQASDLLELKTLLDHGLFQAATALEQLRGIRAGQSKPLSMASFFDALVSDEECFEPEALKFFTSFFLANDPGRAEVVDQLQRSLNNDATEGEP